jgi:hypothetical protein
MAVFLWSDSVAGSILFFEEAVQGVLRFYGLCRDRYEWLSK